MAKATLKGSEKLRRTFANLSDKAKKGSVVVGYTANYAISVHEMINASFQRPGAQAKFLEKPFREMKQRLVKQIETDLEAGMPMDQALFRAGLVLQRASQDIVPVDTGNLRASAFTRIE